MANETEPVAWMNDSGSVIKDAQRKRMMADAVHGGEFAMAAGVAERHNIPLYAHPLPTPSGVLQSVQSAALIWHAQASIDEDSSLAEQGLYNAVTDYIAALAAQGQQTGEERP